MWFNTIKSWYYPFLSKGKKSTHVTNKHEVNQKQIQRSLQSLQSHKRSQEMSHQSDFNLQQWMGWKMRSILGVIFKTICFFPRPVVSSEAIESVFYYVYNECFLRETKKEIGGKGRQGKKNGWGRELRESWRECLSSPPNFASLKCFAHLQYNPIPRCFLHPWQCICHYFKHSSLW